MVKNAISVVVRYGLRVARRRRAVRALLRHLVGHVTVALVGQR